MTALEFCKTTLPGAASAAVKYGINPIGMMAQSALETGWGTHAPGNMYFGIKATNWNGVRQELYTTEYVNGEKVRVKQWFRAYPSAVESFEDYGKLISSLSRYEKALQYSGYNQVNMYLAAIAEGGYATDPNYVSKLTSIANTIKNYVSLPELDKALQEAEKKKM